VVASPDGTAAIAPFENPALATGGTGDVLSGAIGALLAQGLDPFAAARLGVYLHGLAGEAVRERIGDAGLLASDLPDAIALARKRLTALAERGAAGGRLGFTARLAAPDATIPTDGAPATTPPSARS
jgi:NAD(P)H-hydrate epimerase